MVDFDLYTAQRVLRATQWVERHTRTSIPVGPSRRPIRTEAEASAAFGYATATLASNATNEPGEIVQIEAVSALGELDVTGWGDAINTWGLVGREGQVCRILWDAIREERHIDLIQPEAVVPTTALRVEGTNFERKRQIIYGGVLEDEIDWVPWAVGAECS